MTYAALENATNRKVLGFFGRKATAPNAVLFNGVLVLADFTAEYADVNGAGTLVPALTLCAADLPALPHGKPVVVDGINYTAADPQPDGLGLVIVPLRKVV